MWQQSWKFCYYKNKERLQKMDNLERILLSSTAAEQNTSITEGTALHIIFSKNTIIKSLPTCSFKLSGQLNICKLKICPKWTLKSELSGRVTVLDTSLELKKTFINAERLFTSSRRKTSAL